MKSEKIDSHQNQPIPLESPQLPFWGRLESLWLLIGPLCTAIYALCQSLAPNDLWYHVRAGELINRFGSIPTQNLMSYGVSLQAPFYYQSWLSELILFKTLQFGGLSGLQLLRACCLSGAVALVVIATLRFVLRNQGNNSNNASCRLIAARASALASLWGFAMLSNNVDLRPQTFSVLLCGAWIFTLLEFDSAIGTPESSKKKLWWGLALCILTIIWANTHGAFILAILSLLGVTIGKAVVRRSETKAFFLLTILCLLVGVLNPRGIEIYSYVLKLSSDQISQKYIQEWGSPDLSEWHNWLFFLSAPICILLGFFGFKSRSGSFYRLFPYMIVLTIVFLMSIRDMRSIIWFAFFLNPILALLLNLSLKGKATQNNNHLSSVQPPRGAAIFNLVLMLLLLALPLPLIPSIKASLPWPDEFKQRFAPTPSRLFPNDPQLLLDRTTPVEPIEFWAKNPPSGPVFTDMVCGSYMSWATHPQILPLCEPRIEMFPASFWEKYVRLSKAEGDIEDEMKEWGCSQALLDQTTQKPLVRQLMKLGWKEISRGGKTILLEKNSANYSFGNKSER